MQRLVHVVGALQRTPHGNAALGAPLGDDAVVLNVEMLLRAGAVFAFDNVRGRCPHGIDVALFEQEALEQIVRAPDDLILALAFFDGEDRRAAARTQCAQRSCGLAQLVLVRVREQHDGLVAVVHLALGEAGLVGNDQLDMIVAGNIGGSHDGEFAPVDAAVKA